MLTLHKLIEMMPLRMHQSKQKAVQQNSVCVFFLFFWPGNAYKNTKIKTLAYIYVPKKWILCRLKICREHGDSSEMVTYPESCFSVCLGLPLTWCLFLGQLEGR